MALRAAGRSQIVSQADTIALPMISGRKGLRASISLRCRCWLCKRAVTSASRSRNSHSQSCCRVSAKRSALTWISTSRSSTRVSDCQLVPTVLMRATPSRRRISVVRLSSRRSLKVIAKADNLRFSSNCAVSRSSRSALLALANAATPSASTQRCAASRAATLIRWTAALSAAGSRGGVGFIDRLACGLVCARRRGFCPGTAPHTT